MNQIGKKSDTGVTGSCPDLAGCCHGVHDDSENLRLILGTLKILSLCPAMATIGSTPYQHKSMSSATGATFSSTSPPLPPRLPAIPIKPSPALQSHDIMAKSTMLIMMACLALAAAQHDNRRMLGSSYTSGDGTEVYGSSTASTGGNTATSVYHGEAKGDDGAYVKGSSSAATDKYSAEASHDVEGAAFGGYRGDASVKVSGGTWVYVPASYWNPSQYASTYNGAKASTTDGGLATASSNSDSRATKWDAQTWGQAQAKVWPGGK
ncbi:hypothetical protein ACKKBG_A35335 [Auxenochlorella protothecoides x Auxenochlorella symbiontica]